METFHWADSNIIYLLAKSITSTCLYLHRRVLCLGTLRKLSIKIIVLNQWANLIILCRTVNTNFKCHRKVLVFYFSFSTISGKEILKWKYFYFCLHSLHRHLLPQMFHSYTQKRRTFKPTSAVYRMMIILKNIPFFSTQSLY